jgi:hypothetical protein
MINKEKEKQKICVSESYTIVPSENPTSNFEKLIN